METIPKKYTSKHYGFAFVVFLIWSFLIFTKDHILGCPQSHGFMYNHYLHVFMLFVYFVSHVVVIHKTERIDRPTEFAISKMGNVLIVIRQMKFFLVTRFCLISVWLYIVFYLNAEETYIPAIILFIHLCLVLYFNYSVRMAVKNDNSYLPSHREKLMLCKSFYTASFLELFCSILWLLFNIVDIHHCHSWYEWTIKW